jgi:hypothetical protein
VDGAGGIARTPSAPLQRLEVAEGAKGRVQGGLWMLAKIAHAAAVAELGLNDAIAEPFAAPVTVVLQSRS